MRGLTAEINPRAQRFIEYREAIRELCRRFDSAYWIRVEREGAYPEAFVRALTDAGWLAALIPTEYGGGGLGVTEASVILEEINRSGANSGACHAQMYIMGTLLRHGSDEQKRYYLPRIASGEWRLQSFAVTEPTTGTDTTQIKTVATRQGDQYIVRGQKVWISRVQHSDLMLLLARTTPLAEVKKRTDGLSVFLVDLRDAASRGLVVRPIANMVNHETNEVFFEDFAVPAANLIGVEGSGLSLHILDGMNAERILIAGRVHSETATGFVEKGARVCHRAACIRPAHRPEPGRPVPDCPRVCQRAGRRLDAIRGGTPCSTRASRAGAEANMAKLLAAADAVVGSGQRVPADARRIRVRCRQYEVERKSFAKRASIKWRRSRPI